MLAKAERLEDKVAEEEASAQEWDAKAATYEAGGSKMRAANARSAAKTRRSMAQRLHNEAADLRAKARSIEPDVLPPIPASVTTAMLEQRFAEANRSAEQFEAQAAEAREKGKARAAERLRLRAMTARRAAERFADEIRQRAQVGEATETPSESTTPTAPLRTPDLTEQLSRLAELKASGALTDAEFAAAKARLLE